jgi:hypothetical protein
MKKGIRKRRKKEEISKESKTVKEMQNRGK